MLGPSAAGAANLNGAKKMEIFQRIHDLLVRIHAVLELILDGIDNKPAK